MDPSDSLDQARKRTYEEGLPTTIQKVASLEVNAKEVEIFLQNIQGMWKQAREQLAKMQHDNLS